MQPSAITHNHPLPHKTTYKLPKHPKTCHKQLCNNILNVSTETDVDLLVI